ncbi:uncharacterized protein LOC129910536 [Episyrphus balteatus]|uniref:uncharacterized protein LOC129910536 n=1 Tax=Episyrphus balteatus TaxID=286459 RepID=UPI0024863702|nr:uncharacterized protein LOC129910536 [Episyrphus balteatus]
MHQQVEVLIGSLLIIAVGSIPTYSNSNNIQPDTPIDDFGEIDFLEISTFPYETTEIVVDEVDANLRYTFGKRVKNDRLVSQNTDKSYWPSPQNVTLILQYPGSGQGAIVTFVEVIVNQSSNIGAGRIIAGGIGMRSIASIIEGNRTYWFNYSANIYGIY